MASGKNGKITKFETKEKEKKEFKIDFKIIGAAILLILVGGAFIVAPIMSGSGSSFEPNVFGSYNNKEVVYAQNSYFYNQVRQMSNMYRDLLNPEDENSYNQMMYFIWSQSYEQAIQFEAKKLMLSDAGYGISQFDVDKTILDYGYYNNPVTGKFDQRKYDTTTISVRNEIVESIRNSLAITRFSEDNDLIYINSQEKGFLNNLSPDERQITYITLRKEDYPDSEVESYASSNIDLFSKVNLSRIKVEKESTAKDIVELIELGEKTFAELATEWSEETFAQAAGDIGWKYRHNLLDDMEVEYVDEIMSLGTGEYSSIITNDNGSYIYYIDEATIEADSNDIEFIATVKRYMLLNEAGIVEDWLENEAEKYISSLSTSDNFFESAVEAGLTPVTSGYFSMNFGNNSFVPNPVSSAITDSLISDISSSDTFFEKIFSMENVGDISDPILLNNAIMFASLNDIREVSTEKTDAEIRTAVMTIRDTSQRRLIIDSEDHIDNFITAYSVFFE